MTVLVIGSNGQDGSILCDLLDADNQAYIAVSRSKTRLPDNSTRGPVDLSISKEAATFLDEFKPSAIVHLAAVHAPSGSMARMGSEKYDAMVKCHIDISRNILDWQAKNLDSKSIFALSSQMFSADKQDPFINLQSELNPSSRYGETKALCWEMLKEYRFKENVNTIGLVLFNHTSERSKANFLFPEIASQLKCVVNANQKAITIRDANACVDIHSAYDLGDGIIEILKKDLIRDFIFSSGKYFKVERIIQESLDNLDLPRSIEILSTNQALSRIPLHGDISETSNLLDWSPRATPSEILTAMTRGPKYVSR